jgi:hypothetical protein
LSAVVSPLPVRKVSAKRRTLVPSYTRKVYQQTAHRTLAAISAAFLPVAAYVLVHVEITPDRLWLWALVASSLAYSAPSLAQWAEGWCRSRIKAWSFAILLEGVAVASQIEPLSLAGLAILVVVNAAFAWQLAGEKKNPTNSEKLAGSGMGGASDENLKEITDAQR